MILLISELNCKIFLGTEIRTPPSALQMGFRKRPPITGTLIGNVHLASVGRGTRNHNCRKVVLTFFVQWLFSSQIVQMCSDPQLQSKSNTVLIWNKKVGMSARIFCCHHGMYIPPIHTVAIWTFTFHKKSGFV